MRIALAFTTLLASAASSQTLLHDARPAPALGIPVDMYGATATPLGDVDGDGFDDYAVGRPGAAVFNPTAPTGVTIHSGADGAALSGMLLFDTSSGAGDVPGRIGAALTSVADVDGDGRRDLVVGAPGYSLTSPFTGEMFERVGEVQILSSADLSTLAVWASDDATHAFGSALANVGDVDGDLVDDLLVGAPGGDFVELRSGADGSLVQRIDGPVTDAGFGAALVVVGDVAGDARPEFAVVSSDARRVDVVQLDGTFVWGADDVSGALDVADVDADGVRELVVGVPLVPFGGLRAHDPATGAVELDVAGEFQASIGGVVAGIADVDEDGHEDVVAGLGPGSIVIVSGADGSLRKLSRATSSGVLFAGVARLGDVDGDGRDDFGVGATSVLSYGGALTLTGRPEWSVFTTRDVPILDVGLGGVTGSVGVPVLRASGSVRVDFPVTVELFDAAPGAPGLLVLGTSKQLWTIGYDGGPLSYLPPTLKGGVLVPSPQVSLPFVTDAAGRWSATARWPALDDGALVYAQAWVADAAAHQGFASTTALQFTTSGD